LRLNNKFINNSTVVIAGCGGTGGFVAEDLCRILPVSQQIILVDPDIVEERNLIRQNYSAGDIGKYKCEALADHLCARYKRKIGYFVGKIKEFNSNSQGLLLGCVDNGPARADIALKFVSQYSSEYGWWIDAGNENNFGQILVGNSKFAASSSYVINHQRPELQDLRWDHLPLPTLQRPDLLTQVPGKISCLQAAEQGSTINRTMASLMVETVRQLINNTLTWFQLYVDMDKGVMHPIYADEDTVKQLEKNIKKEV